jgi:CO dehydrogenase maturation factor
MKIAIAGKGGVGKTLLAAGLAWTLARSGTRTIAIDADPSPNLALSLGVLSPEADAIVPITENSDLIRKKTGTAYPGVYNLNFSVDDVIRDFAIATPSGVFLIVMGTVKAMGSGCTCPANSVIRNLLRHVVIDRDEAVVLDMEAGIEHLGRGTAEGVDLMVVVSDANKKSLAVAGTIAKMARDAGIPRIGLVGNRIAGATEEAVVRKAAQEQGLAVIGIIPFDPAITRAGIVGSPVPAMEGLPAIRAIEEIGHRIIATLPEKTGAGKKQGAHG